MHTLFGVLVNLMYSLKSTYFYFYLSIIPGTIHFQEQLSRNLFLLGFSLIFVNTQNRTNYYLQHCFETIQHLRPSNLVFVNLN